MYFLQNQQKMDDYANKKESYNVFQIFFLREILKSLEVSSLRLFQEN